MKIIIAGAGEVGFHLAKLLSFESHDITLIDNKKSSLNIAENKLDIKTIEGNSASISVLKNADVENSDLVVSLTTSETTNFTTCFLSKQLGAKRTIARISNTEFIKDCNEIDFDLIGIDELTALTKRCNSNTWQVSGKAKVHLLKGLAEQQLVAGDEISF